MNKLLINCYYDGLTLGEAIGFVKRCYSSAPTEKQIDNAVKSIKSCTNKEWK